MGIPSSDSSRRSPDCKALIAGMKEECVGNFVFVSHTKKPVGAKEEGYGDQQGKRNFG
jgi:hypothetical protein